MPCYCVIFRSAFFELRLYGSSSMAHNYFVPTRLPVDIKIDPEMMELYGEAMLSLGKFAEAQTRIPSKRRFLDVYIAKEAVFSRQIENRLPRTRKNAGKLLVQLCYSPIVTVNEVMELLGTTYVTAQKLVNAFVELEILKPMEKKQRNKTYALRSYLNTLEKDSI